MPLNKPNCSPIEQTALNDKSILPWSHGVARVSTPENTVYRIAAVFCGCSKKGAKYGPDVILTGCDFKRMYG